MALLDLLTETDLRPGEPGRGIKDGSKEFRLTIHREYEEADPAAAELFSLCPERAIEEYWDQHGQVAVPLRYLREKIEFARASPYEFRVLVRDHAKRVLEKHDLRGMQFVPVIPLKKPKANPDDTRGMVAATWSEADQEP